MDRNQIVEVPPSMRYLIFCAHTRVCACAHTTRAADTITSAFLHVFDASDWTCALAGT
jgi:hypothetical protein